MLSKKICGECREKEILAAGMEEGQFQRLDKRTVTWGCMGDNLYLTESTEVPKSCLRLMEQLVYAAVTKKRKKKCQY